MSRRRTIIARAVLTQGMAVFIVGMALLATPLAYSSLGAFVICLMGGPAWCYVSVHVAVAVDPDIGVAP